MLTISPISKYNPNFKAYYNTVMTSNGGIAYRGDTCLFRSDLNFSALIKLFEKKYADTKKVNVIVHACSAGQEVYSLLAQMDNMLGVEKSKKFLPLSARDINSEHIKYAKNGYYAVENSERDAINYYLGDKFNKYFDPVKHDIFKNYIKVKDNIKSQVKFKISNILKDAKNTDFTNTIVLARNFWPYINQNDATKLATYLSQNMDNTSLLVIGDYDKAAGIGDMLETFGFRESEVNNVYQQLNKKHKIIDQSYFNKFIKFFKK